jgi:hypothetical protein
MLIMTASILYRTNVLGGLEYAFRTHPYRLSSYITIDLLFLFPAQPLTNHQLLSLQAYPLSSTNHIHHSHRSLQAKSSIISPVSPQ